MVFHKVACALNQFGSARPAEKTAPLIVSRCVSSSSLKEDQGSDRHVLAAGHVVRRGGSVQAGWKDQRETEPTTLQQVAQLLVSRNRALGPTLALAGSTGSKCAPV
jgi:hypothetical protein